MGPKINARQQRHVGALGNTMSETQVSVAALCSPARTGRTTSNHPPPSSASPVGGMLERILSSLAWEWLRITNGHLIVEDPEPAPRCLNKLMRVNGAERRKVVRAFGL
jgi:hypothetical protein